MGTKYLDRRLKIEDDLSKVGRVGRQGININQGSEFPTNIMELDPRQPGPSREHADDS